MSPASYEINKDIFVCFVDEENKLVEVQQNSYIVEETKITYLEESDEKRDNLKVVKIKDKFFLFYQN